MPKTFEVDVESPISTARVLDAFGTAAYWHDRFDAFGTSTVVDQLTVHDTGRVDIITVQDLRRDGLPSLLTKVYRGDLQVKTTETWIPLGNGDVTGELVVEVIGAPGSGGGSARMTPHHSGSHLTFSGVVRFPVPVVGGRIESYVGEQFSQHIPEIQDFTTDWVRAHG